MAATLLGFASPAASLGMTGTSRGTIVLVARDGGPPIEAASDDGFVFHFANGFEDEEGRVVLDGMRMVTLPAGSALADFFGGRPVELRATQPTRFVVDLRRRSITRTRLTETRADLPTVDPRFAGHSYRYSGRSRASLARRIPSSTTSSVSIT